MPTWSVREPLARWLQAEGASARGLRVLDVGCGVKPYRPFFTDAAEYVGIDLPGNPHADLIGSADRLPVEDAAFDVVLCLQVLEHVDDPEAVVRELRRATRPGGRLLLSTHGVQRYHPAPVDHWRWTHTGLERMLDRAGPWRSVTVTPGAGTAACLGMLLASYVALLGKRLHAVWAMSLIVSVINRTAAALDARVGSLHELRAGALVANYHVVAER